MGRRALPKLDPTIDYSAHIAEVESLENPLDPQSFFDRPQELEIEIGSGKGLFVHDESGKVPERNFLGNEIATKYCQFAAYRLAKSKRTNAFMLRGDGLKLFKELLPDRCAVAVHVYFPDPWWKERHRRRRVMQPNFIADLQRVLCGNGIFHFWTDVEEYFEETIELMGQHSDLQGPIHVEESEASHDMDYRTHFERRMRKNEHDVFRCQFKKNK
ncbi:MAG: tRNA (guanosine(46)-N7)-methyltransferase TrmB [Planctomycetota bacterium]